MVKEFLNLKMDLFMMVNGLLIKWKVMFFNKGTFKWKNGCIYTGNFVNDLRNGQGVMIYPSNFVNIKYDGYYVND